MERMKALEAYIREFWDEKMEQRKRDIEGQQQHLKQELCQQLFVLIEEQEKEQKKGIQEAIKYLFLCRLSSSGYTNSYEAMLGLSNSLLYLDQNKSYTYWYPKQIYSTVDKDLEEVFNQLKKNFIRIEKYELFYLKQRLLLDNWDMLVQVFTEALDCVFDQFEHSSLVLDRVVMVLCGNYMEQLQIVKRMEGLHEQR